MQLLNPKILLVSSTLLVFALTGCITVPETGRKGLAVYTDAQISQLAASSFGEMKRTARVSNDYQLNQRLQRVGERIVQSAIERGAALPPPYTWEFVVFADDQKNAFAMPGGKVGFYTGILDLFASDDELAVVMGHEVAHVAAQHGNQRMSTQSALAVGGMLLGYATREEDQRKRAQLMAAYGLGAQVGVALPFSRRDETEADEIGLIYMANAGYDPRAALDFWQKMAADKGAQPPQFLSTHPSDSTRMYRLRKLIPKALEIYHLKTLSPR